MTTPSVPAFLAGFGPQQGDFTSLWTNPATFFQGRVVFRATQTSGATTIPHSGAEATIAFNNIIEDPYSGWSSGSHSWTPPSGYSGWYQVLLTVWVTGASTTDVVLTPAVTTPLFGGASFPLTNIAIGTTPSAAEAPAIVYLAGGQDSVKGQASVANASADLTTDVTAGQNSSLEILWLSS